MMVDRIGSVNSIQPGKQTSRNDAVSKNRGIDSVAVSTEAMEKAELFRAMEIVSATSDVDVSRIEELKQKINNPDYINEKLIGATADRIMDAFGL